MLNRGNCKERFIVYIGNTPSIIYNPLKSSLRQLSKYKIILKSKFIFSFITKHLDKINMS